jgi:hypothetical protein
MRPQRWAPSRGQSVVELALVLPLFLMVLIGIISLGIGVFYQQQVTNAAREAARYASIHSATARCPVVGQHDPNPPIPPTYSRCDRPQDGWPDMTAAGRGAIFGLDAADVRLTPCWSGYVKDGNTPPNGIDYMPPGDYVIVPLTPPVPVTDSTYMPCRIGGVDPAVSADSLGCAGGLSRSDTASSASEGQGRIVANQVTVYACTVWNPPMAGFLLIPDQVTLRAVVTEPIERQQ